MDVIGFLHTQWKEMTSNCSIGSAGDQFGLFNSKNTMVNGSPCKISQQEARREVESQPAPKPSDAPRPTDLENWHFLETQQTQSKPSSSDGGDTFEGNLH